MKISIDVDCTPNEIRTFLGLPDVQAMQDAMMAEIQSQMMSTLQTMDTETLFKTWLPVQGQGMEQMQKAFWSQFVKGTSFDSK